MKRFVVLLACLCGLGMCAARRHPTSVAPEKDNQSTSPQQQFLDSLFDDHTCGDYLYDVGPVDSPITKGQGGEGAWKYLLTTPFEARHKLVAAEFQQCRHIIEVGARSPDINIKHYLTGSPKTVTVVDPGIPALCTFRPIGQTPKAVYRQVPSALEDLPESGFDCLLALGLDCWTDAYVEALVRHARLANVVVLERAIGLEPAQNCARRVAEELGSSHSELYKMLLDFSPSRMETGEDCLKDNVACPKTNREMAVFSRKEALGNRA